MKTIYNTYVKMESQEQCDRMKQLCIDNKLRIFDSVFSFNLCKGTSYFGYTQLNGFAIYGNYLYGEIKITEQEFIKLLQDEQENK